MISIIIPVKEINSYIRNYIGKILNQSYQDFEIIILPNEKTSESFDKTRVIASGKVGPAEKRDLAAKKAKGDILAFIDDDAYPVKDWLEKSLIHFKDKKVGIVGGPNVTPPESNFFQKVSGDALASKIVSGPEYYRYTPTNIRKSKDLPSCNLLIRKSVFNKVKGFDTNFWPGEDTKLCLDVINKGYKIIYDPKVKVYHHRRENFKEYCKQIYTYATHRGFFAKKYSESSFKLAYFIPSLFVLGLIVGPILSIFANIFAIIYLSIISIYLLLLLGFAITNTSLKSIPLFLIITFTTHILYGLGILKGLFKKDLRSKYRK